MWGEWKTGRAQIQTSSKFPNLFHMISMGKKFFQQLNHNSPTIFPQKAQSKAAREIAAVRAFRRRYKRAFGRLQWKRAEQKRMTTISAKPMTVAPSSPTSGFSAAKAMAPSSAAQAYTCLTKI